MENRKGLRSLIPTGMLSEAESTVQEVPLDRIVPNRYQPRKGPTEEGLGELAESIKAHGILQPLMVRRVGTSFELIAGERRLEAAKRAGLARAPVVIRETDDRGMLELALVENLQREDINPMDAAEAYARLTQEFGLTQEQIAERVGKSRSAVSNAVRLLALPEVMQEAIRRGRIQEGHGKILAGLEDPKARFRLFKKMLKRGLSVREASEIAERLTLGELPKRRPAVDIDDPVIMSLIDGMMNRLSARVKIKPKGRGGMIEVTFADADELDRIYSTILGRL